MVLLFYVCINNASTFCKNLYFKPLFCGINYVIYPCTNQADKKHIFYEVLCFF